MSTTTLKKETLDGVIQVEKKCDRLKEKFTQVLFKDKRALPFLVEDRYNILMMLDSANDKMEFFARSVFFCPLSIYSRFLEYTLNSRLKTISSH